MARLMDAPAAWDESLAKIALLGKLFLGNRIQPATAVWPYQRIEPARVFLLKHAPHLRRLIPVATNEVSVALDSRFRFRPQRIWFF